MALSDESALAEAGLQPGDVVTAINGEDLDIDGLAALLEDMNEDATVTITIERNGEAQELDVPAEALSEFNSFGFRMGQPFGEFEFRGPRGEVTPFNFEMMPGNVRLGVQFTNIDADVAAENDLSVTDGALITEVLADSPAEAAGLQAGDVVVSVSGDVVDAERTLRDRLYAYEPEDVVTLEVLREGETLMLDVTLGAFEPGNLHSTLAWGTCPLISILAMMGAALLLWAGGSLQLRASPIDIEPAVPAANV